MNVNDLPLSLVAKMEGDVPIHSFEFDGCSCAPDRVGGADLRPACYFHDWAYAVGGDKKARLLADSQLFRNLMTCGLSRFKANIYYRRVRLWGVTHFNWGGDKPTLWARIVLFFSRYLSW